MHSCGRPDSANAGGKALSIGGPPSHDIAGTYQGSTLVFRDSIFAEENNHYLQGLSELSSDGRRLLNHEIGIFENGAKYAEKWGIDLGRVAVIPELHRTILKDFKEVAEFETWRPEAFPKFLDRPSIQAIYQKSLSDTKLHEKLYGWFFGVPSFEDALAKIQAEFREKVFDMLKTVSHQFEAGIRTLNKSGLRLKDPDAYYDQLLGLMEQKRQWMYDKPVAVLIVLNRFVADVFDDKGGKLEVREIPDRRGRMVRQYTVQLLSPERFGNTYQARIMNPVQSGGFQEMTVNEVGVIEFCQLLSDLSLVECPSTNPQMPGPRLELIPSSYRKDVNEGGPHIEAKIAEPSILGFKELPRDLTKLTSPKPEAYFQEIPESNLRNGRVVLNFTFSYLKPGLKTASIDFQLVPGPEAKRSAPYKGATTMLQRIGGPAF
jgi:hypothetical protein